MTINYKEITATLEELKSSPDGVGVTESVIEIMTSLAPRVESLGLYALGFEALSAIEDFGRRTRAYLLFMKHLPKTPPFLNFYVEAMAPVLDAVNKIEAKNERVTALMTLEEQAPKRAETLETRMRLWRLALGFAVAPDFKEPDPKEHSKELPKTVDYVFYRRFTLLGIAAQLPREEPFQTLFVESMKLGMAAAEELQEPYYRMFALTFIGEMIAGRGEMEALHNTTIRRTYEAAKKIMDPLASELALIELLGSVPKKPPFIEILDEMMNTALNFFSVKSWMSDVDVYDVVDYVLSAEEVGLKETKQNRLVREKYAVDLGIALEGLIGELKDMRFIDTLKPYTHVWIKPKELRRSVQKVIDYLEELSKTYRGSEILRPINIMDKAITGGAPAAGSELGVEAGEVMAIDLGATNTVVMKRSGASRPEFIDLASISKRYGSIPLIPTVLGSETNEIGTGVNDSAPLVNIKQRLMEGAPEGAAHVERFYSILYRHLKGVVVKSGWFKLIPRPMSDVLYLTVPVGFKDYSVAVSRIASKIFKGVKVELIEEPLAAALGYQVAECSDKVVMLLDFGGCTLNSMVVRLNVKEVNVVAKPDMALVLGGNDIDYWLAQFLAEKIGLSASSGEFPRALMAAAEDVKVKLSSSAEVPFVWDGREVCKVSRTEFEEVLDSHDFYRLVDRSIAYLIRRAEKVGLERGRIEAVILTGGTSQIPSFKDKVGHLFSDLRRTNRIYDHSPHTAVAEGAVQYGTRDVVDRHLSIAYALRYATEPGKESLFSYSIVLEKGVKLPMEKVLRLTPAEKLGVQNALSLELYEVPDSKVARRWVREDGIEFIKQEIVTQGDTARPLHGLKSVTVDFGTEVSGDVLVTLSVDESGLLSVKYGPEMESVVKTDIRLQ
jgi:molecular chaperone DnaK (HSP70)